jgi:hypothetical protein
VGSSEVRGGEQLPAGRSRLVVILGSLSAFGPLSLDMYLPGLPALSRDLQTGAAQGAVVGGLGLVAVLPALLLVVASVGLVMPNATALALAEHARVAGSGSALLGLAQFMIGGAVAPLVGIGGSGTALPMALIIAGMGTAALVACLTLVLPALSRQDREDLATQSRPDLK